MRFLGHEAAGIVAAVGAEAPVVSQLLLVVEFNALPSPHRFRSDK